MNSMTKHIPVCKNMTGNHEQDAEEESSASEGERETVGKHTGKETVGKSTGKEAVGNLLERHQTHRMFGTLQKL